jgi:hypothetical protein
LFTNYELGVWKVAPMAVHNVIDVAAGAVFLGLTTKQAGASSYRRPTAATSRT